MNFREVKYMEWLFDKSGNAELFLYQDRFISREGRNLGWLYNNDVYHTVVQTAIDNYNQMKENKENSGGNYYNTMGSRLDG